MLYCIAIVLSVLPLASNGASFDVPLTRLKDDLHPTGVHTNFLSRWAGNLAVGMPSQKIKAIFNTGSASFFIPVKGCVATGVVKGQCEQGENVFSPEKSATFTNTTRSFDTGYGGNTAKGYVFKDSLVILGKNEEQLAFSENVFIGAANYLKNSDDAVFGLPSQQFSRPYEHSYNTVLQQDKSNTAINSTFFTLYTSEDRALLTIGGLNDLNCEAQVNYSQLIPASPVWEFKIDGFTIREHYYPEAFTASVDSGSGYISMPGYLLSKYVTKWKAINLGDTDSYAVPCNTELDVVVEIGNVQYPIPSANLLHPLPEHGKMKFGASLCQVAVKTSDDIDVVTLGEPFLRSYCVVHDIVGRRVGFSHKTQGAAKKEGEGEHRHGQDEGHTTLRSGTRGGNQGESVGTTQHIARPTEGFETKSENKEHDWYESRSSSSEEEYGRKKRRGGRGRRHDDHRGQIPDHFFPPAAPFMVPVYPAPGPLDPFPYKKPATKKM